MERQILVMFWLRKGPVLEGLPLVNKKKGNGVGQ